jgi:diaminohydroxyphosphoribosylaminopyrimidine deaminase/5-amino-6-(5-phosphoribosylamino)uracil reductase
MEFQAFARALAEAERFAGATSPNPPVGAAAIDREGYLLSVQAHEKAGTAHAEAKVLDDCARRGLTGRIDALVVTLEPCNHHGRTPPCTEAILAADIRRVVFGARDPNPRVAGGGAERLRAAGVDVAEVAEEALSRRCGELIAPFAHWARTGLPWVTVKRALDARGSMIPPAGAKTFASPESLRFAHELRRRADAIITGSGTVLADQPEFTVRRVPDHPGKRRWLAVLDRRGRVARDCPEWFEAARGRGFDVLAAADLAQTLRELGAQGVVEALVEAGPGLSEAVLAGGFWNRHVVITQGTPDRIEDVYRDH